MLYRKINESLALSVLLPQHAQSLFELTDKNRNYLRQWLPWVDSTIHKGDTEKFIHEKHELFTDGKAADFAIEFENKIVGVIGYHEFDTANNIGTIGYWLGEEYNGYGFMTMAVKEMIFLGFSDYALNRIEIRCAAENSKSRAIPERLGFVQEGILRSTEKVNGKYLDLVVYGLLKAEAKL